MAIMNKIKLYSDVGSMTKVMPRIEALYYFIYELAQSFYADEETLNSIKNGVLDNQILSEIHLKYINANGEKVAGVIINIDWNKHKMLAKTDSGKTISVDMERSIVDNIVGWRKYIVAHIDAIMKQYDVASVRSHYKYRDSITSVKSEYDNALAIMNHVCLTDNIPNAINSNLQSKLDDTLQTLLSNDKINGEMVERKLECGVLEEVTVNMVYKKF